ncbi:helix-turn-helix transcriptional regulator [Paenibacillus kyungheensis]
MVINPEYIKNLIGSYIKKTVIPEGMTVKDAAELLGVGRPALSNLLNGKASLSADMAARMERAFGVNAHELMDMQAMNDTKQAQKKGVTAFTKAYVPPFMQFKAIDIEQWAATIKARTRFAVFLRTLINSTGQKIKKIDFPGNDDAERPGWDGFLETEEGTPWIPTGLSGWEFGTNNDPKPKADKDYKKSIEQTPFEERQKITFVFVTPRRWNNGQTWRKERLRENNWKDVLVLDASDLEQWLEQSISGQAWFAGEFNVPAQGVKTLDKCWEQWIVDTEPPMIESMFDEAVEKAKSTVLEKLTTFEPITISSDSTDEALAFLNCLFTSVDSELSKFRDRVAVFTTPGALSKLATKPADFIAVIPNHEVEREFAPYKKDLRGIIIYPSNGTNSEPDIVLEPLSYKAFHTSLGAMGYNDDEIDRLGYESGRSLTVLRRRLSSLESIRSPEWASDKKIATVLSCFLFAGVWDDSNEADKEILSLLSNGLNYSELEREFTELLLLTDSPVWSIGRIRGLVSKMDALYAINKRLVWEDIKRFLDVASLVLSEDDPSLDLPEEHQWAASIFGKTREISSRLRTEISKSLVLLAVHGETLFRGRLGHNLEFEVGQLIHSLLSPLTMRKLEEQSSDLPNYAEAAPDVFLKIFEDDLRSEDPHSIRLMKPVNSSLFGRHSRTGLLWALESVAWSPEYLRRTVDILGKLSEPELNDNLANKPIASLNAIFRSWMPQTTTPLAIRITAFKFLVQNHPKVAWSLCMKQISSYPMMSSYSHKPRWRTGAHGAGQPVQYHECNEFVLMALDCAIGWECHSVDTLGDLVSRSGHLPHEYQDQIWNLIEAWSSDANEEDKALLREKIRITVFTRYGKMNKNNLEQHARKAYDNLEPTDVVIRHEWLFKYEWVEESDVEIESEEPDYTTYSTRIEALRLEALETILRERGLDGVLELAGRGETAYLIGKLLFKTVGDQRKSLDLCKDILARGILDGPNVRQLIISGLMLGLVYEQQANLIYELIDPNDNKKNVSLLLQAPFTKEIWDIVETLGPEIKESYWKKTMPPFFYRDEKKDRIQYALDHLIGVNRPRAAFKAIQYCLDILPPKLLYRVVAGITTNSDEATGSYLVDSYKLNEAFKVLTASGEIPVDQMASLEFKFIETLSREKAGIPNLEKYIEAHPELFVQALVMVYRRGDGREDPEQLRVLNQQVEEQRAKGGYHLLESLSSVPGHDSKGELNPDLIEAWVQKVRELASELARRDVCDKCLGTLFSKAPVGKDGIWPCEPVREVIERIWTENFAKSTCIGLYNSRGVYYSSEGGDAERKLAENYLKWASELEFSYPSVAEIHKQMAKSYQRDAVWEDEQAGINRRLLE